MPAVQRNGPIWNVSLSEAEVQVLVNGTGVGALALPPPIDAAVGAIAEYVSLIDELGGNNGVEITGVIGASGAIVTPHGSPAYAWLSQAVNIAVDVGKTIGDFLIKAAGAVPNLAKSLASEPAVLTEVALGLPVVAVVASLFNGLFGHHDDPNPDTRGAVKANRPAVGDWESFLLMAVDGGQVALLSWQGFFSARNGGGGPVYANRPWVQVWEHWTFIRNDDGTVSFRTSDGGHYLGTSATPDDSCFADQTSIVTEPGKSWCRFQMASLPAGHISLKAITGYVSVQPTA
jgi:hypothetical protein